MSGNRWVVIGTDARMSICCTIMQQRGHDCRHLNVNEMTEELLEILHDYTPNRIVFPILQMEGTIPIESLQPGAVLYVGVASEEWLRPYVDAGFSIVHYLKDEEFILENAELTADAFAAAYLMSTKRTIVGEDFHIAGFGRVGKTVSSLLSSLGGHVTIIARSATQLGEATLKGYAVQPLEKDIFIQNTILVNTIPSQWLKLTNYDNILIFDLASAPGCLTDVSFPEYYTILPGLPGKYFPIDAAIALADAFERMN